jgi:hypothetical protein
MGETILDEQHSEAEDRADEVGSMLGEEMETAPLAELAQSADESTRRLERWIVEQRRRVADGLDAMLIHLERRREAAIADLDAWKVAETERIRVELAEERERLRERLQAELDGELAKEREDARAQMLEDLKAFEEQLGLRLQEQEERIARWWDEAEDMAARRFAALGLERPR